MPSHSRIFIVVLALILIGGLATAFLPKPEEPRIGVSLAETEDGAIRLSYRLAHPARGIDLGPTLDGFRDRDWKVETIGVELTEDGGHDILQAADRRRKIQSVEISVRPTPGESTKQYLPINRLTAGTMLFTGHFWPYSTTGKRAAAEFSFTPNRGDHVIALGGASESVAGWSSPYRHPAFIYFGQVEPIGAPAFSAVLDPHFPEWARAHLLKAAPAILAALERLYGSALPGKPQYFVFIEPDADSARLAYDGDALPSQVQLVFKGGGWRDFSPEGARMLDAAIAHEGAHLWQTATRPSGPGVPAWIHEGAADAIAAEALVAAGRLTADAYRESLRAAESECGGALDGRSLIGAENEGVWRASYACGHVLNVAAARLRGDDSVAAFWRAFDERAHARGYDEELFFALVAEKAGKPAADRFRRFPHTVFANPAKEARALIALSGSAAAPASP